MLLQKLEVLNFQPTICIRVQAVEQLLCLGRVMGHVPLFVLVLANSRFSEHACNTHCTSKWLARMHPWTVGHHMLAEVWTAAVLGCAIRGATYGAHSCPIAIENPENSEWR